MISFLQERSARALLVSLVGLVLFLGASVASRAGASRVLVVRVAGVIGPVSSELIIRNIERAEEERAACLIIEMDTPGGLVDSMKDIVKRIMSARVPVVVYVSPSGSGAVSAGVFITMASHIAAMAPGTNIGAAHPVAMGGQMDSAGVMADKVTNWASAYMRSIAEKRGRNAKWAEDAVRESRAITEKEAYEKHVIEFIVPTIDSLLVAIHGREVELDGRKVTMDTRDAEIVIVEMDWRLRFLDKITNPSIAYILMMLGIYGIFLEFSHPGAIYPGVLGGIFLIVAFFALQHLPVNYAGLALIILGLILFILEVKITSYGALTIGGVICMVLGSIMLVDTPVPMFQIPLSTILPATIFTAALILAALTLALRAQGRRPATGIEGMIGEVGIARATMNPYGDVEVHGEIWKGYASDRVKKGERVRVVSAQGLSLVVEKSDDPLVSNANRDSDSS